MGSEVPKFQPILDYYLFQKKIKDNINNKNKNEVDNKKKTGYFIYPEWIKEWKKKISYELICELIDYFEIIDNKLNEKQLKAIQDYITAKNIPIDINNSFQINDISIILYDYIKLTEEILQNLIDTKTFYNLNLSDRRLYKKVEYLFKKQMMIFLFDSELTMKILIHSLEPYKNITNLINLKFVFNNRDNYKNYIDGLIYKSSQRIIDYLLTINIFSEPIYKGTDEFNNNVFILYNEEIYYSSLKNNLEIKVENNNNQNINNSNNIKTLLIIVIIK